MKIGYIMTTLVILLTGISSNAVSVVLNSGYYNKYLGFSSGSVFHDEPVLQTALDFNFDNGWSIGVWNSTSFDGEENYGDEDDYKLAWSGMVSEKWNMCLTMYYFDLVPIRDFGSDDMWFFEAALSRPVGKYGIGFKIKNYTATGGSSFAGGWIFETNISRAFQITDNLSVFCKAAARYDDGVVSGEPGFLLDSFTSVNLEINDQLSWDVVQFHSFSHLWMMTVKMILSFRQVQQLSSDQFINSFKASQLNADEAFFFMLYCSYEIYFLER